MHARLSRRALPALLAFALVLADSAIAAAAPPADALGPGVGRPRVHLRIPRGRSLTLYEVLPGEASTSRRAPAPVRPICNAPCDRVVDGRAGQSFVLGGPGLSRSLPFTLSSADASLEIHARPGRRALWIAGCVLTGIGAAAVLAGAATLTAADDDRTLRRAGGFTFLAGLPFVAGGVVMVAFGRTRFRLGERSTSERSRR
jgi:hypothetical protein